MFVLTKQLRILGSAVIFQVHVSLGSASFSAIDFTAMSSIFENPFSESPKR